MFYIILPGRSVAGPPTMPPSIALPGAAGRARGTPLIAGVSLAHLSLGEAQANNLVRQATGDLHPLAVDGGKALATFSSVNVHMHAPI